jgi:hypothetical protein
MKLYMFRTVPLSVIESYSLYTHQWYMSYKFVDSFRAGSEWNWICSWVLAFFFLCLFCYTILRVGFVHFFFGVSILVCFLCLFAIDEFYIHVTVHRDEFP